MPSTTSNYFPLATVTGGDGYKTAPGVGDNGGSGENSGYDLSTGGLIAIIIVVVLVAVVGATTAALFFFAKQREWTVKETIRRSARKVVTVLTPRRSQFPDSVKDSDSSSRRGLRFADEVPPTPRLRPEDMEKGLAKAEAKRKRKDERK